MVNKKLNNRQTRRLKGYNYSKPGYYFVTICTADRHQLFGDICNDKAILNKFGNVVKEEWLKTPKIRPYVELDVFVVMPNHIHGIIVLTENINSFINTRSRGVLQYAPAEDENAKSKLESPSHNLGAIIRGFKGAVTSRINKINNQMGDKVWQRNYHDQVLRNEKELKGVRTYIKENPGNWNNDKLNKS